MNRLRYCLATPSVSVHGYLKNVTRKLSITNNRITLTLESPINVISFPTSQHFDFFHLDSFLTRSKNIKHGPNIQNLIRTDHLNDEEKSNAVPVSRIQRHIPQRR
jgi:hypothetical protein